MFLSGRRLALLELVTQACRSEAVREKHKQQTDTNYQHRHDRKNQTQALKLQVHEVSHDQRGLDD